MRLFTRKTRVVVTQTRLLQEGENAGKPGTLTMKGVDRLDAREGVLFGKRGKRVVLILPLAEVAMAQIEEMPDGT